MKFVYYLDLISSWCVWAEPAWAEVKHHFAGRATFEWRMALMDASGLPRTAEQSAWFYRRSGTIMRSPAMMSTGWFEPGLSEYLAPNLVSLAAREGGWPGDEVRLAIAKAALFGGQRVADWSVSAAIAEQVTGEPAGRWVSEARSERVEQLARKETAEFQSMKATQRPTFLLENAIGDRVMFSGTVSAAPIIAAGESMLADAAAYASYAAHFGPPPAG